MSDLSDEARAFLDRVREGARGERVASTATLARVRSKVLARAGVATATAVAGTTLAAKTAAAAPAPPTVGWLLAAKTLGGLAIVSAIVTGGVAIERRLNAPPDAPSSNAPSSAVPRSPSDAGSPTSSESAAVQDETTGKSDLASIDGGAGAASAGLEAPTSSAKKPAVPRGTPTPAASALAVPSAPRSPATEAAWAADLALLRDAQASMAAGDPHRARELARRVSPVTFDDEREALLTIADCMTTREESDEIGRARAEERAKRRAATFANARADSSLAARVRAACALDDASKP